MLFNQLSQLFSVLGQLQQLGGMQLLHSDGDNVLCLFQRVNDVPEVGIDHRRHALCEWFLQNGGKLLLEDGCLARGPKEGGRSLSKVAETILLEEDAAHHGCDGGAA